MLYNDVIQLYRNYNTTSKAIIIDRQLVLVVVLVIHLLFCDIHNV